MLLKSIAKKLYIGTKVFGDFILFLYLLILIYFVIFENLFNLHTLHIEHPVMKLDACMA